MASTYDHSDQKSILFGIKCPLQSARTTTAGDTSRRTTGDKKGFRLSDKAFPMIPPGGGEECPGAGKTWRLDELG